LSNYVDHSLNLLCVFVDFVFWSTVCKTVCPMLSDRCPVCLPVLSVCNVGVLWPNGWTDQDKTWHAGRPPPWPHCVRWGPSSPLPKGQGHSPQFSAHICCRKMAGWIKMSLGREVGLGPSDIVLHGTQLPSPKGGRAPNFRPCLLWSNVWIRSSRCHLVWR